MTDWDTPTAPLTPDPDAEARAQLFAAGRSSVDNLLNTTFAQTKQEKLSAVEAQLLAHPASNPDAQTAALLTLETEKLAAQIVADAQKGK